jgi:hypothetical protein
LKAQPNLTPAEQSELATAETRLQTLNAANLSPEQRGAETQKLTARIAALKAQPNLTPAEQAELAAAETRLQTLKDGAATPTVGTSPREIPRDTLRLTPQQLATVTLAELRALVAEVLPQRTVTVMENYATDKLDLQGFLLDRESLAILNQRLAPVKERVTIGVEVDPNAVVREVKAELHARGFADLTVYAFLGSTHHRLFIGVPPHYPAPQVEEIRLAALPFVIARNFVEVARIPTPEKNRR